MSLAAQRPRLALFDLDHTLIPMDSDHGWGEFAIAMGWCDRTEFGRRNDEFFAHYQAGTLNVPRLRALCHGSHRAARRTSRRLLRMSALCER